MIGQQEMILPFPSREPVAVLDARRAVSLLPEAPQRIRDEVT